MTSLEEVQRGSVGSGGFGTCLEEPQPIVQPNSKKWEDLGKVPWSHELAELIKPDPPPS